MKKIDTYAAVNILSGALGAMDAQLLEHAERTAYIMYHILRHQEKYGEEEIYDFVLIGLMHDMGAYKTEDAEKLMDFEFQGVWAHAIYSFLYLKYLSPVEDYAQILLYHHMDYPQMKHIRYAYMDVSAVLRVSDRLELFMRGNYESEEHLNKFIGRPYSPRIFKDFFEANKKYGTLRKLADGSYKIELDQFFSGVKWRQNKTDDLLRLLLYVIDFKNEDTALRSMKTGLISKFIAKRLNLPADEQEAIRYAGYLCNLGMLDVPGGILNAPRKLTERETERMRRHIDKTSDMIRAFVPEKVHDIAVRHHEKLDGSGYPQGLRSAELTLPQRVLAVADIVAAMMTPKPYRRALPKEGIVATLRGNVRDGELCPACVDAVLKNYSKIYALIQHDGDETYQKYIQIKQQFDSIIQKFDGK